VTTTDATGTLELRLVDAADTVLGSRSYPLEPNSPHQVNDVFSWLGVPPQGDCRVELEVVGGRAAILGYASIIDNLSGDAVFVPAAHVPRRDLGSVSLSNRDNCVLVDQLPGAQGVDRLPPGLFRAELTGEAFVGPGWFDDLIPVCLYRDVYGNLQARTIARYYPLEGISGDAPFWCLVPDWRTRDDNSGQVQVVLSNGVDGDIVLTLDARLDAVLIDRLPEAITIDTTHSRYHLTTTGDLGRPGLEPHALVVYGAMWQGSLASVAAGHGSWVEGVSVTQPLVAVVLDWIRSDDNTGQSVLTPAPER